MSRRANNPNPSGIKRVRDHTDGVLMFKPSSFLLSSLLIRLPRREDSFADQAEVLVKNCGSFGKGAATRVAEVREGITQEPCRGAEVIGLQPIALRCYVTYTAASELSGLRCPRMESRLSLPTNGALQGNAHKEVEL